jgi:hypothetical protein
MLKYSNALSAEALAKADCPYCPMCPSFFPIIPASIKMTLHLIPSKFDIPCSSVLRSLTPHSFIRIPKSVVY